MKPRKEMTAAGCGCKDMKSQLLEMEAARSQVADLTDWKDETFSQNKKLKQVSQGHISVVEQLLARSVPLTTN